MTSKFRNKVKQILYRPAKKSPNIDFVVKKLGEAEKALDATVGGVFGGKRKKTVKKQGGKTDKEKGKGEEKKEK